MRKLTLTAMLVTQIASTPLLGGQTEGTSPAHNFYLSLLGSIFGHFHLLKRSIPHQSNDHQKLQHEVNKAISGSLNDQSAFEECDRQTFSMNIAAFIAETIKFKGVQQKYREFLEGKSQLVIEYIDQPLRGDMSTYVVSSIRFVDGEGIEFTEPTLRDQSELITHSDLQIQ